MLLFEFFDSLDAGARHLTDLDATAYDLNNDTRKSRLTLEMINQLRQSIQQRRKEQREDRELYQKMYGGSVADSAEPTL